MFSNVVTFLLSDVVHLYEFNAFEASTNKLELLKNSLMSFIVVKVTNIFLTDLLYRKLKICLMLIMYHGEVDYRSNVH